MKIYREILITKGLEKGDITAPKGNTLFTVTMAADLISNPAYYSLIGAGKKKQLPYVGSITGIAAGVSALTLTSQ